MLSNGCISDLTVRTVIWIMTKMYHLFLITTPECHCNPFITFAVMLLTDKHTERQTNATENIISLA